VGIKSLKYFFKKSCQKWVLTIFWHGIGNVQVAIATMALSMKNLCKCLTAFAEVKDQKLQLL
jgi:hypothetical protein